MINICLLYKVFTEGWRENTVGSKHNECLILSGRLPGKTVLCCNFGQLRGKGGRCSSSKAYKSANLYNQNKARQINFIFFFSLYYKTNLFCFFEEI